MVDNEAQVPAPDQERQKVFRRLDAIEAAEFHVRTAKGVLDTMPESRDLAPEVEKFADKLAKKAEPLRKQIEEWREEARQARRIH